MERKQWRPLINGTNDGTNVKGETEHGFDAEQRRSGLQLWDEFDPLLTVFNHSSLLMGSKS